MTDLTTFGRELRKLRIDQGERMLDMARKLSVSSSFLSAVEMGQKSPPADFEDRIAAAYRLSAEAAKLLRRAADVSREAFTVRPKSDLARDTVGMLTRQINVLPTQDLEKIRDILRKRESPP